MRPEHLARSWRTKPPMVVLGDGTNLKFELFSSNHHGIMVGRKIDFGIVHLRLESCAITQSLVRLSQGRTWRRLEVSVLNHFTTNTNTDQMYNVHILVHVAQASHHELSGKNRRFFSEKFKTSFPMFPDFSDTGPTAFALKKRRESIENRTTL